MNCILCGAANFTTKVKVHDNISYLQCNKCGLVCQHPMPSEVMVQNIYSQDNSDYFVSKKKGANHAEGEEWLRQTAHTLIKLIQPYQKQEWEKLNILDFGCGTGILLSELKALGANVAGIELSPWASEYARSHFGLTIYNDEITKVKIPDNTFDLIIMSHVIEHLPNPQNVINILSSFLKPEGCIVIATPDSSSLGAKIFQEKWLYYLPNEHIHLFNASSLQLILQNARIQVIGIHKHLWRKRTTVGALLRLGVSYFRSLMGNPFQYVASKDGIVVIGRKKVIHDIIG